MARDPEDRALVIWETATHAYVYIGICICRTCICINCHRGSISLAVWSMQQFCASLLLCVSLIFSLRKCVCMHAGRCEHLFFVLYLIVLLSVCKSARPRPVLETAYGASACLRRGSEGVCFMKYYVTAAAASRNPCAGEGGWGWGRLIVRCMPW